MPRRFYRAAVLGGLLVAMAALVVTGAVLAGEKPVKHAGVDPFDLPLESYLLDTARYGIATQEIVAECMAMESLEFPTSVVDLTKPEPQTSTRLGYFVMSEERVRRFGYREELDRRIVKPAASAVPEAMDKTYQPTLERCANAARSELGSYVDPGNVVLILDGESRDAADADPAVDHAITLWQQCMREAGVRSGLDSSPGRPKGPEGYRIHVLQMMNKKYHPGMTDTMMLPPTREEMERALQDVRCQDSSGYAEKYFDAVSREQERLITENRDSLQRARVEIVGITNAVNSELED